jgi:RNA polymerase sigma-70 factor (ECF subfamily)
MASKGTNSPDETLGTGSVSAELLAGCRSGLRDAQRGLYEKCHQNVYRLAVRMVGVQDAPDVTQQVFMQVFRKIDQFTGQSKFETWLYRVAVNEALQHLRKKSRRESQELTQEPVSRERPEHEQGEAKEVLDQALTRLDPELRSIFVLREVEGLSYGEIAVAIEIPEGTVGSRLNRARRELRHHLTELGWEP